MKVTFPAERPDAHPPGVWSLQQDLLKQAENLLGPRDRNKKIYQPVFKEDGPYIINTPNLDGAFAALSMKAAGYWPTVVYELSHETVHLLNPVVGNSNWLEEGLAVLFSVEMSQKLTDHPMAPDPSSAFHKAMALVKRIPCPAFFAGKRVRSQFGPLSMATTDGLADLFSTAEREILSKLTETCKPR